MAKSHEVGLSDREQAAVTRFVQGATPGQIAEDLGVNINTVLRWRNKPEFIEAVKQGQEFVWSNVVNKLVHECLASADVLSEIRDYPVVGFQGDTKVGNLKLNASKTFLEYATRQRDFEALKMRVEALEARLAGELNENQL
jgi:hypothetical protein